MRQGPLTGRYPAVAAMVVFALVPYLGLSAALQPLSPIIARQLHMSVQAMSLDAGDGQRRLRDRHRICGPVRAATAAEADAPRLRRYLALSPRRSAQPGSSSGDFPKPSPTSR